MKRIEMIACRQLLRSAGRAALAVFLLTGSAGATVAQDRDAPDRLRVTPLVDTRLRFETVDQPTLNADALTLRVRAGAEAGLGDFSLLAEAEANVAPIHDYNAFPFALSGSDQSRPAHAVVADPENAELNRLQLQYRFTDGAITVGRQRINLDDQRWIGSVGWRQNEQTFDAVRGEARRGSFAADVTYAISQRTIFGEDAGPRTVVDGDFVFAGLSARQGAVQGKLFAYLLDFNESFALANSSQTYGGIVSGTVPLGGDMRLNLRASYARQSDHGRNPFDYAADYWSLEGGTSLAGFNLAAGWEQLGSDNGRAVQTPMATLHKFNGWADMFLTTPPNGLSDLYLSVGRSFDGMRLLPGLAANVTFHQFDSAGGGIDYGREWDASVGFRAGPFNVMVKFADYDAEAFGVDTRKIWFQLEWSLAPRGR
jgi:hypothetical protein